MRLASALKLAPRTSAGVVIVAAGLPSANVHTFTVLSAPPLTARVPSLLRSRLVTAAPWSIFSFDVPAAVSQTCTVLSAEADTRSPLAVYWRAVTPAPAARGGLGGALVSVLMSL